MTNYSPNPEYSDLPFARPKAWGSGRHGRGWSNPLPRLIVVHHTAGSESLTSAEGGAGYDQTRTDGTSAHYYVDGNSIVQCVETWNRANTAFYNGNTLGIQYELCGTLQTRAQWLDTNSYNTLRIAAKQMRRDMQKYGIPLRKLTSSQVAAGQMGFCGHVDITYAFPQDNGTHTDPGPDFPWDVLFELIKEDEVADISQEQTPVAYTEALRVDGMVSMTDPINVNWGSGPVAQPNLLAQFLRMMDQKLDVIAGAVDIDDEELQQIKDAAFEGGASGASSVSAEDIIELMKTDPELKAAVISWVNEAEDS